MKKFEQFIYLLAPLALGLTTFFLVTGGYIVIPTNIAWLGGGFDPTSHYLGWVFYRFGPWTVPIGLNPNFGLEFSNSIVFSDSIPIFAILFKSLSSFSFLSIPFQYLGLWTCICLVMQAYVAWKLIGIFTCEHRLRLIGAVIISFSPPMLARIGVHSALVAHFLILMGLYLHFSKPSKYRFLQWLCIIGVASLTHFYLLAMILMLWIADLVDRKLRLNSFSLYTVTIEVLVVSLGLYFLMWQAGYFSIHVGSATAGGYGFFRMNLLSIFDPRGWSYFLKTIPMPMDFGDGFNYPGLGGLFLLGLAAYALIKKRISISSTIHSHLALLVLCIFLSLFAITNNIGFGNKSLLIPLPEWMMSLASNLRGSGRMFWPVYYCLQLATIYVVVKAYSRKHLYWILTIAALMQVVDTSAGWLSVRKALVKSVGSEIHSPLKSEFWTDAAGKYAKVIRVPAKNITNQWEVFADYAAKNYLSTNFTFLARIDQEKLDYSNKVLLENILKGSYDRDTLYIFESWKLNPLDIPVNTQTDLLGFVDGYIFLAPRWHLKQSDKKYRDVKTLKNLAPEVEVGVPIDFSKTGIGREFFLLDGWGYSEEWGTWSDGSSAMLRIPMPLRARPNSIEINMRAFVAPGHPTQNIDVIINGVQVGSEQLSSFEDNQLKIVLSPDSKKSKFLTIEIKLKNPAEAMQFGGVSGDARMLGVGLKSLLYR